MSQSAADHLLCPRCGAHIHRVPRRWWERVLSVVAPRHRYQCFHCNWTGVRAAERRGLHFHLHIFGREAWLSLDQWLLIFLGLAAIVVIVLAMTH
jgi:hypothetical protein